MLWTRLAGRGAPPRWPCQPAVRGERWRSRTNETLRQATEEMFASWIDAVAERFTRAGLPTAPARELAISLIGALEGAFVLCRSMRTTVPLEIASRTMSELVRQTLDRDLTEGYWSRPSRSAHSSRVSSE